MVMCRARWSVIWRVESGADMFPAMRLLVFPELLVHVGVCVDGVTGRRHTKGSGHHAATPQTHTDHFILALVYYCFEATSREVAPGAERGRHPHIISIHAPYSPHVHSDARPLHSEVPVCFYKFPSCLVTYPFFPEVRNFLNHWWTT